MIRPIAVTFLLVSSVVAPGQSEAQSVSEQAAADALFDEGVRLRKAGDHAAACDRFQRSQAIDPALGTLQNIGMCLDEQNQLVAALGTFQKLLDKAEGVRDLERIGVARSNIKSLRKRIPKLQVTVPAASRMEGLEILVNGKAIAQAIYDFPAPVDPGSYVVTARAPRHVIWTKTVELEPRRTAEVVIPALLKPKEEKTQTAEVKTEVVKQDHEHAQSDPAQEKRSLSVGVSAGISSLAITGVDNSKGFAATIAVNSRVRERPPIIEVGGMMSLTAFEASGNLGESVTTGLYSLLANASVLWPASSRLRFRSQVGAGVLLLTGLGQAGHPLLKPGITAKGNVSLPQVRLTLGFDYQIATWTHLVVNPLVYWYSQAADEFAPSIDGLTGYEGMIGASHQF